MKQHETNLLELVYKYRVQSNNLIINKSSVLSFINFIKHVTFCYGTGPGKTLSLWEH